MKLLGDLGSNPVQAHIEMRFKAVANAPQQLDAVLDDLRAQAFDPARSRVLVFVRTRRQAEETTLALKTLAEERHLSWAGQVDFFHAGLDGHDRADKYAAYKPPRAQQPVDRETDEIVVLVATKAFGMGMDIGNIHYLYHLGPSSTFEDFLQEVGRAGRDETLRQQAGFTTGRPIRAMCVATREDFGKLRDLQHRSDLSWDYLARVQDKVHQYVARFRPLATEPPVAFPLPLDLKVEEDGDNAEEANTKFRLALHWLEELKRLRLGMYTPASLPLRLLEEPVYWHLNQGERQEVEQFVAKLRASPLRAGDGLLLPVAELLALAGKRRWNELTRLLYQAQRVKALCIERYLTLTITDLRRAELTGWRDQQSCQAGRLPLVEGVFALARQLLEGVRAGQQRSLDGEEWDRLVREISDEEFRPRQLYWEEVDKNKRKLLPVEARKKLVTDWQKKRAKFALKLVRLLPHTRVQSELNRRHRHEPRVVQLIYNGAQQAGQWRKPLSELQAHLTKLLAVVVRAEKSKFNYADLVLALGLEDAPPDYLNNLLFLARALGYLRGDGSLVPMGIELFLDNLAAPDRSDRASDDYRVSVEFEEGLRLKELRLIALQCLANLRVPERQDGFIKRYFQCDSSEALLKLLEEYLPENHPSLAAFQKEALVKAEANLSTEQREVYDAPLGENLQVLAGPGSGKTHTLTLRVARLVQKKKVPPEQILVLAYNRAVVVELKDRLGKLFRALGYGRLIQRLHVHTFHSLCRRCLGAELDGREFDEWVPLLAQALERTPGLLERELGRISYVFVDEFQDITELRLRLLQQLAPPVPAEGDPVRLCVIGDPNQSIYGYERVNEGGAIDPYPYYVEFHQRYQPKTLYLSNNYRSYPAILEAAAGLLAANEVRFQKMPALQAARQPGHPRTYCELLDCKTEAADWKAKLRELLAEEYEPGKPYQQVAVMLRSNDEVLRAFNALRQECSLPGRALPPDVELRIQGTSTSPLASREFHQLFQGLRATPDALLEADFTEQFKARKEQALADYGHVWDPYLLHLAHCLLAEFRAVHEGEALHQDLLDFIQDLARKDDGHFAKLYDKHRDTVAPGQQRREVVFTTMHKVKGLEFDAVILPPSYADFGLDKRTGEPAANLSDLVEEERRLLYVAYTRARYRLVVLTYEREAAVAAGQFYTLGESAQQRIGRVVAPGIDKLFISWGADEKNAYAHAVIRDKVKVGDPVTLKRSGNRWLLFCQGLVIGQLEKNQFADAPQLAQIQGLAVSGVACYTLEEPIAYDKKQNPPSSFTEKYWGPTAKSNGYVYLVDFAGYYRAE
ncbi:MAG: UvrD-helicase domain-containing protein [Janthinobacterium lividum]